MSWYNVVNDQFLPKLGENLANFQKEQTFVDMTLSADGHLVKVHQILVSLVSPYFKQLILSLGCPHPVIHLHNVSFKQLSMILEYIYTGEVNVHLMDVAELCQIAKELKIVGLENLLKISLSTLTRAADQQKRVQQFSSNMKLRRKQMLKKASGKHPYNRKDTVPKNEELKFLPSTSKRVEILSDEIIATASDQFSRVPLITTNEKEENTPSSVTDSGVTGPNTTPPEFAENTDYLDCVVGETRDTIFPQISGLDDSRSQMGVDEQIKESDSCPADAEQSNDKMVVFESNKGIDNEHLNQLKAATFCKSRMGQRQLCLNNYIYTHGYTSSKTSLTRWRCIDCKKKCKAVAYTSGDVVVRRKFMHNHARHTQLILQKLENKETFSEDARIE